MKFSREEAKRIYGLLSATVDPEEFFRGINVELEHGSRNPATNVINDDPIAAGKIALAHLDEMPDYYTRLAQMEGKDLQKGKQAEKWGEKVKPATQRKARELTLRGGGKGPGPYVKGRVVGSPEKTDFVMNSLPERINNFIEKQGRVYLKPGSKPPKGSQVFAGPRGALFYADLLPGKQAGRGL